MDFRIDDTEARDLLGIERPVRWEFIDLTEARGMGLQPDVHGAYNYDINTEEHVVYLVPESYGKCSHNINETAIHELVHAAIAEKLFPKDPHIGLIKAKLSERLHGYENDPLERAAHALGALLDGKLRVVHDACAAV